MNGGGTSKAGQGTQRKQTAAHTRCACLFLVFLLLTDYLLQLPHPPNTKNARHTRVFRVRALPLQPNTQNMPTWARSSCWAASPPSPALSPRQTRKTCDTCIFFMFGGSPTPALVPNTKIV